MKRIYLFILIALAVGLFLGCQGNETPLEVTNSTTVDEGLEKENLVLDCDTILDGTICSIYGYPIETGLNYLGYNFQAHFFKGLYCDSSPKWECSTEYEDVKLVMKWNDTWLSNVNCSSDNLLDRHRGFNHYIGSDAWLTNEISGKYFDAEGTMCRWNFYAKIVAVPTGSYIKGDIYYTEKDVEIGPAIWEAFAIIEKISDDPCGKIDDVPWTSPEHEGLWDALE